MQYHILEDKKYKLGRKALIDKVNYASLPIALKLKDKIDEKFNEWLKNDLKYVYEYYLPLNTDETIYKKLEEVYDK